MFIKLVVIYYIFFYSSFFNEQITPALEYESYKKAKSHESTAATVAVFHG